MLGDMDEATVATYDSMAERWTRERGEGGEVLGHSMLERPAMLALLPDVEGADVLCLGCGSSDELSLMLARGARRVVGVDASEGLLEIAHELEPRAGLVQADLDSLGLPESSFDLAWASLALHYARDLRAVLRSVHQALRPGGRLLLSLPHPIHYGAERERADGHRRVLLGFEEGETGLSLHGDYLTPRIVSEALHGEFPVSFSLVPVSEAVSALLGTGFRLLDLDEPRALPAREGAGAKELSFCARHQALPLVMVLLAQRG
jgi:SAM-dependent methyltransferase